MRESHSHLPGTLRHTRISASKQASDQAVKELCGIVSPVTTDLLQSGGQEGRRGQDGRLHPVLGANAEL